MKELLIQQMKELLIQQMKELLIQQVYVDYCFYFYFNIIINLFLKM
jgi:hypothetical protein